MLFVWLIAMIFIGIKAINSTNAESNVSESMIDNATLERIKPIGMVAAIAEASAELQAKAERSGEQIYNANCMGCHNSGVLGSPKYASLEDWAPRIGLGVDKLTASAIAGKGGMPAKGTCMDCSDNDIKITVQYMLDSLE
jgi:cytochrome c5